MTHEYISKKYLSLMINSHLSKSMGAEHYAYERIKEEINNAPTLNYTEPKLGKWMQRIVNCWREDYCSMCGGSTEFLTPYCPHCGAYMIEVDTHD